MQKHFNQVAKFNLTHQGGTIIMHRLPHPIPSDQAPKPNIFLHVY